MDNPGLSVRAAVSWVRAATPACWHEPAGSFNRSTVAANFAARFGGVPATSSARDEDVVRYRVAGSPMPALLGLYGSASRVRQWLPGLPRRARRTSADRVVAAAIPPRFVTKPVCQERIDWSGLDLRRLPVLVATPRDAGPYLTMGMLYAEDPETGEACVSVHRMLVLARNSLAVWMVPARRLRAMHEAALRRSMRLAVSVNIGAPPAAVVASALTSAVLPVSKLDIAGALAGAPVTLAPAVSQPTSVLAESEIVLEGYLDDTVADETLGSGLSVSLPEFLGYDGEALPALPALTVTAITTRRSPLYQAVIGPGREQSVILGLAGELSVSIGADPMITDLHYAAAGGGMLLLFVAVRKESPAADRRLASIAQRVFARHPFTKLIIFVDDDIDVECAEDVWWAVTTRANLGADCTTFDGFRPVAADPSQGSGRTFVDATTPYAVRSKMFRSFSC